MVGMARLGKQRWVVISDNSPEYEFQIHNQCYSSMYCDNTIIQLTELPNTIDNGQLQNLVTPSQIFTLSPNKSVMRLLSFKNDNMHIHNTLKPYDI